MRHKDMKEAMVAEVNNENMNMEMQEEEEEKKKSINYLDLLSDIMDFSNYPRDHARFDSTRAAELGFWKDELCSRLMIRYIGLRSKTYSYLLEDMKQYVKCKGVRAAAKRKIAFDRFEACLENLPCKVDISQVNIRAKNHTIYTLRVRKTAFTSFDDKRWLFNCGRHSSPYGSNLIRPDGSCPFCNYKQFEIKHAETYILHFLFSKSFFLHYSVNSRRSISTYCRTRIPVMNAFESRISNCVSIFKMSFISTTSSKVTVMLAIDGGGTATFWYCRSTSQDTC